MLNIGMENKPYEYTIKYDGIRAPYVSDLLVLDTRDVVDRYVVDNVYRIEFLGCQQYDNLYRNGYSRVRTIFLKS